MVMVMEWKKSISYFIIMLVLLGLFGNISQAYVPHESVEKCDKEVKTTIEEDEDGNSTEILYTGILKTKRFGDFLILFNKIMDRFPIIRQIVEWILQLIYNHFIGI
jgi:regulatory protein YycI of two-component signal transduction system YycFG